MKKCIKCKRIFDLNNFYKQKSRIDGLFPYCKKCAKISRKIWAKNNPTKIKALKRKELIKNNKNINSYAKEYRKTNPEKVKLSKRQCMLKRRSNPIIAKRISCRNKMQYALQKGILKKKSCEYPNCKYEHLQIEAHHWNYNEPLKVVWLCSHHHAYADTIQKINSNQNANV